MKNPRFSSMANMSIPPTRMVRLIDPHRGVKPGRRSRAPETARCRRRHQPPMKRCGAGRIEDDGLRAGQGDAQVGDLFGQGGAPRRDQVRDNGKLMAEMLGGFVTIRTVVHEGLVDKLEGGWCRSTSAETFAYTTHELSACRRAYGLNAAAVRGLEMRGRAAAGCGRHRQAVEFHLGLDANRRADQRFDFGCTSMVTGFGPDRHRTDLHPGVAKITFTGSWIRPAPRSTARPGEELPAALPSWRVAEHRVR